MQLYRSYRATLHARDLKMLSILTDINVVNSCVAITVCITCRLLKFTRSKNIQGPAHVPFGGNLSTIIGKYRFHGEYLPNVKSQLKVDHKIYKNVFSSYVDKDWAHKDLRSTGIYNIILDKLHLSRQCMKTSSYA